MAIVQFCDDDECKKYFDAYSAGIRVDGDHVIAIEKSEGTDQMMLALKEKIEAGASRLVRVSGVPGDKTFQDLRDIVTGLDVDHLLWRAEDGQVSIHSTVSLARRPSLICFSPLPLTCFWPTPPTHGT